MEDSHPITEEWSFRTSGNSVTGSAEPPEVYERGWKDTVRAHSNTITRYVWHCHVLEHEDNDMMRPYEVVRG